MSEKTLPDAPSTERNRQPILQHLRRLFKPYHSVLEIGSGTGQHAVYFSSQLPQVIWQTSERAQNIDDVRAWLAAHPADNLPAPLQLDVSAQWPQLKKVDAVFTANTLHIMSADSVRQFFAQLPQVLSPASLFIAYGPVKIAGEYIGSSNGKFDLWLQERDQQSGIRDLEWLEQRALEVGLTLVENNYLPANNQLLVWQMQPCGN